jgi:hypothetical protein
VRGKGGAIWDGDGEQVRWKFWHRVNVDMVRLKCVLGMNERVLKCYSVIAQRVLGTHM